MDLSNVTPVILTYNEELNIRRVLEKLRWAKDIVIVDSLSTDRTVEIAKRFANVKVLTRAFDTHERQWNYAIHDSGVATEWVLTLDADYVLADGAPTEIAALKPDSAVGGFEVAFRYCVKGRPLPRAMLPNRVVLFRRARGRFRQDGHTQRVHVEGEIGRLRAPIDHDDRKSLSRWLTAQDRYAQLERDKLLASPEGLKVPDRIRKAGIFAPIAVLVYLLLIKRLAFAGLAGWHYTYQRVTAEIVLSLYLIESALTAREKH